MLTDILKLALMTLCPVTVSAALYLLDKRTALGRLNKTAKQLIFGVIFGGLAVLGTEAGVSAAGATINVRDASPLCAGLFFGAPAGIIAGVIGGVERWFAVLWGAGSYTRLACTLGTIMAGVFGAGLRKWLFDDKKPSWFYALTIGAVTEILHLLLVFVTNMGDVAEAFYVVRRCALPMILCNGLAVMLTSLVLTLLSREITRAGRSQKQIAQTFQRWLLVCVVIAFLITNGFIILLQSNLSDSSVKSLLSLYIEDVRADIEDASNENMLRITRRVADRFSSGTDVAGSTPEAMKEEYDVSEISIIDVNGTITVSTTREYLGFSMYEGEQSREFLVLLHGEKEFVQSYRTISHESAIGMKYAGVALPAGGFVQVGYDAKRFQKDIGEQVVGITRNRHVGESGCIVVMDAQQNIVSDSARHDGQNLGSTDIQTAAPEGAVFRWQVYGEECCCMYGETEGYFIVAALPVSEAVLDRDISVCVTAFMETLIFAALFILIYYLIKKLVVENIRKVNGALAEITGGNLDVTVNVRSNEEFASLSDDINSTVVTLKRYIAEAAARIDRELEFAKTIQESTLPSAFPAFPERSDFDIYAQMTPAREVGGDFYDFYMLPDEKLAFLVADVSGKGISAAMFMMKAKTLIKSLAEKELSVDSILTQANAELCENNEAEMFVTCFMGILELDTGIVTFANAGHNPPLVRHADGRFEYFKSRPGFVLGGMEGICYRRGELALLAGDEIFLYTDGVTEATNAQNELYGDARLRDILNASGALDADTLCRRVKADVDAFVGDAPQFDDTTMLSIKISAENSVHLRPDTDSVPLAAAFLEGVLERAEVPMKVSAKLGIALDEIYSNIVKYSGASNALVSCKAENGRATLVFADDGTPYDPLNAKEPDVSLGAAEREVGGLGIFMVKKCMDSVRYYRLNGKNILILTKAY